MKVKLVYDADLHVGNDAHGNPITKRVTRAYIHEHPEAHKLVRLGMATPYDDECQAAAGMNAEQMQAAIQSQLRAQKGILPEDWDDFDAGKMDGYDRHGNPIPGPNAPPAADDVGAFES